MTTKEGNEGKKKKKNKTKKQSRHTTVVSQGQEPPFSVEVRDARYSCTNPVTGVTTPKLKTLV